MFVTHRHFDNIWNIVLDYHEVTLLTANLQLFLYQIWVQICDQNVAVLSFATQLNKLTQVTVIWSLYLVVIRINTSTFGPHILHSHICWMYIWTADDYAQEMVVLKSKTPTCATSLALFECIYRTQCFKLAYLSPMVTTSSICISPWTKTAWHVQPALPIV